MNPPPLPVTIADSDADPDALLERYAAPSRLGQRPGLERIRALLTALGEPQRTMRILHIGGTSGKGSTATIAAAALQAAGLRVGLHVKPHLESVEERFVVDGQAIRRDRLAELIRDAAPIAETVRPSWYELTVALALRYFAEERVDVAVVEVGLGGTYDATNVAEPPVTILTNVGLDHTEILGDTVEQIAADKVGIVKAGQILVSGVTQPGPVRIVDARCREVGAARWQAGRDVRWSITSLDDTGARFDLDVPGARYRGLGIGLLGAHQVANASLAAAGAVALTKVGLHVGDAALRRGLAMARVPGRLEVYPGAPTVILDGAHNPDKMAALAVALDQIWPDRPVVGVLGFKRGHDLAATLAPLAPRLGGAILTSFDATTDFGRGQAVAIESIVSVLQTLGFPGWVQRTVDPIEALQQALARAAADGLVVVTGSLYLVGGVRPWLRRYQAQNDAAV